MTHSHGTWLGHDSFKWRNRAAYPVSLFTLAPFEILREAFAEVCCSVLQCAAVCCSVSWYVTVCCSVLQCVAALYISALRNIEGHFRWGVLQCVAVCCSVLQPFMLAPFEILKDASAEMCCSVLRYVAACCSVLQCVAVCCRVLQCVAALHISTLRNVEGRFGWGVLQSVAVCCSLLQPFTSPSFELLKVSFAEVYCSVLQCVAVCWSCLHEHPSPLWCFGIWMSRVPFE